MVGYPLILDVIGIEDIKVNGMDSSQLEGAKRFLAVVDVYAKLTDRQVEQVCN